MQRVCLMYFTRMLTLLVTSCYSLSLRCLPQAHVFEHVVNRPYCLGWLWNLQEVEPPLRKWITGGEAGLRVRQLHFLFPPCLQTVDRTNQLCFIHSPAAVLNTMVDCSSSNCEPKRNTITHPFSLYCLFF